MDPGLDRDRMVEAAFLQLEEDGLDGLSMRRLAGRLGVKAPALYWHVADKAELLGLMAGRIYAAADRAVGRAPSWQAWLAAFGRALRASFAAHRDGVRLCAIARPPAGTDAGAEADRIAAPLVALGLERAAALSAKASVISLTLGWSAFETNGPMHDFLETMIDFDESFEASLDALIRGLAG